MSKQETTLEFMLGMTHEEFEHWVWCGEHSDDNVVDLHKEALRLREEVEKWKALAEAKVVFASNENNEYQYELQEDNIWLRKELEEVQQKSLERALLEMWQAQGIKEIYKYKHRIKIYRREGLEGYDLFNDITCGLLFAEVEDTANYRDATPEDFKVSVEFLLGQEGEGNR